MQFVLADTRECAASEWHEITGKVNCESLSVDGFRFAPRTALIIGVSWDRGQNPVVDVERLRGNTRSWLGRRLGRQCWVSIEWYPRSMEVDRFLRRCRHPRLPRLRRFARILRWLALAQHG